MEESIQKTVVFGVISWTIAFAITRRVLFSKYSFEFSNRLVSSLHAILAVTLASLSVQDWKCPMCPMASTSSYVQMQTLAVTLSYLIYDMVCCLFGEKVGLDNSIHHLVSIAGILAGLYYKKCGSELVAALWVTEMSSPFLHLRELLKEIGYRDTPINLAVDVSILSCKNSFLLVIAILGIDYLDKKEVINEFGGQILFAAIFTIARMMAGPYITYVTLSAKNPPMIKAMGLGLQLVSAFWFMKIVRMMKYKLKKRTPTKHGNGIKHTSKVE